MSPPSPDMFLWERPDGCHLGEGGGSIDGVGGLGGLLVGAFAAEVVLPDLNAVNGVVHGVAGVVTFPGYARPAAGVEVER